MIAWKEVHTLASLHDERNTVPPLVLDVGDHSAEGGAAGILGNGLVLLVGGLAAIQRLPVLANNDVLGLNGVHRTEDTNLVKCQ